MPPPPFFASKRVKLSEPELLGPPIQRSTPAPHNGMPDHKDLTKPSWDPRVPLYKQKDGVYQVYNVKPVPYVRDGSSLPGAEDRKRKRAQARKGFRLKHFKKPIVIGPVDEFPYDTTQWAKTMNENLERESDAVPTAPFVWLLTGGIGRGKSTMLNNILKIYEPYLDEIYIVSPTLKRDMALQELLRHRIPGFKIKIDAEPDLAYLAKKSAEVDELLSEVYKDASVGLFQKEVTRSALRRSQLPYHDPSHPYINEQGDHHGERLRLPNHNAGNISHLPVLTQRHLLQQWEKTASAPRAPTHAKALAKQLIGFNRRSQQASVFDDEAHPNTSHLYQTTIDADLVTPDAHAQHLNVEEPDLAAFQTRAMLDRLSNAQPGAWKDKEEKKGFGLVLDDCSKLFHGPHAKFFERLVTQTRHSRMLIWMAFHKCKGAIPMMPRTVATDLSVFPGVQDIELADLREEFGGNIPDFESAYHACTATVDGCERDFMHVRLGTGRVSRSLYGELVPIDTDE